MLLPAVVGGRTHRTCVVAVGRVDAIPPSATYASYRLGAPPSGAGESGATSDSSLETVRVVRRNRTSA